MTDQIYVDPNVAGNAQVIKVAGVCYQRVGPSSTAAGSYTLEGQYGSCGDCTADPCAGAPSAIAILDYDDSYFTGCSNCMAAIPGDCIWDGTFQFFDVGSCTYSAAQCFNGASFGNNPFCFDCSFNNQRMWQFNPPGLPTVAYDSSTGIFTFTLTCQIGQNAGQIVWQGTKTGGDFSGVYNRTGGCDPRATVQIA